MDCAIFPTMKPPSIPMPAFKPAKFVETKPEDLPRDPLGGGDGWSFKTLAHDQHTFPTAIEATDAEDRSCLYVPLEFNGKIGRWEQSDP